MQGPPPPGYPPPPPPPPGYGPPPPTGPQQDSKLPLIGGIFILLAGVMAMGIGGYGLSIVAVFSSRYGGGGFIVDMLATCFSIILVFGIIALVGGIMAILKKVWGLALVGGIFGMLGCAPGVFLLAIPSIGVPLLLGAILSLVGLILVAISKNSFR